MSVIAIAALKGGSGKTSVVTNLAAWLAVQGIDFALVDADRQRSSVKWCERRNAVTTGVQCAERLGPGLYEYLVELERKVGLVLVDVGGRDSVELRQVLLAADYLYSPITPSQLDIETLGDLQETVKLAKVMNPGLEARLLITQVELGRGRDELQDARETLAEYAEHMPLLDMVICRRKVYRQAVRGGFGVVESDNKLAKAEISLLAGELFGQIRNKTAEQA